MIVVVGSCVLDMVFEAPHLPVLGETVLANSLRMHPGGKGLNQAIAARRSGSEVAMIGRVGRDEQGDMLIAALEAEGVDVGHVSRSSLRPTGVGVPVVVPGGDNGIVFCAGANAEMSAADIEAAAARIAEADTLLLQLELPIETAIAAARVSADAGGTVILNAAPARAVPRPLLEATSILVVNQLEAETISGQAGVSARQFSDSLDVSSVIVTRGERGIDYASTDASGTIDATSVHAVDTVGAGDTFVGALAAALTRSDGLAEAVSYASVAAAVSVTRHGAGSAAPTSEEVASFMRRRAGSAAAQNFNGCRGRRRRAPRPGGSHQNPPA